MRAGITALLQIGVRLMLRSKLHLFAAREIKIVNRGGDAAQLVAFTQNLYSCCSRGALAATLRTIEAENERALTCGRF